VTFLWVGTVFASPYTIDDLTLIVPGQASGTNTWTARDYLGSEFDTSGINVSGTGSVLTLELYTNFPGLVNVGSYSFSAADLALSLDGIAGYEIGVDLSSGSVFSGATWLTSSDLMEGLPSNYYYGEKYIDSGGIQKDPIVKIDTGTNIGNATVTITNPAANYLWTVALDLSSLGISMADGDIDVFWGTATCANDVIEGSAAVPEPATLLLLGTGLVGLAGFHRRVRKI
jgi:hypothetical protein